MKLSQRIIIARQQKGYTQEELATLAGLSIRTIQRIESGENVPRGFTLKAIAAALNLPAEQFLAYYKEQPTRHQTLILKQIIICSYLICRAFPLLLFHGSIF